MKDINIEEAKNELEHIYNNSFNSDDSYYIVNNFIDNLEKENEELKKQLAITDKALDKAIEMFIYNNENKCPIAEKDCEDTEWEYKGKKHNCNECLKDYLVKEKKFILDKINESEYAKKVLKVINIDKAHLGGTIRRDWSKALKDVKRGAQLSNLVSYALSDHDLANLAEIYLQGNKNMQEKIEDLLTDCNFHTVCSDFMEGYYGKYIERAKMI